METRTSQGDSRTPTASRGATSTRTSLGRGDNIFSRSRSSSSSRASSSTKCPEKWSDASTIAGVKCCVPRPKDGGTKQWCSDATGNCWDSQGECEDAAGVGNCHEKA